MQCVFSLCLLLFEWHPIKTNDTTRAHKQQDTHVLIFWRFPKFSMSYWNWTLQNIVVWNNNNKIHWVGLHPVAAQQIACCFCTTESRRQQNRKNTKSSIYFFACVTRRIPLNHWVPLNQSKIHHPDGLKFAMFAVFLWFYKRGYSDKNNPEQKHSSRNNQHTGYGHGLLVVSSCNHRTLRRDGVGAEHQHHWREVRRQGGLSRGLANPRKRH